MVMQLNVFNMDCYMPSNDFNLDILTINFTIDSFTIQLCGIRKRWSDLKRNVKQSVMRFFKYD
jgi:hypothetical protein